MKTFKTELGICLVSFYNWCQKNYLHFHKSAAIVVAMAVSAVVTYPILVFSRLLYSEGNWPLGIVLNPPNPLPNSNLYPLMTPFKFLNLDRPKVLISKTILPKALCLMALSYDIKISGFHD